MYKQSAPELMARRAVYAIVYTRRYDGLGRVGK